MSKALLPGWVGLCAPDRTFDAVISLCAVRHFPDVAHALAEMLRVLRPGGRIVVSCGYFRPITLLPFVLHIVKRLLAKILSPVRPQLLGPAYLTHLAKALLPEPIQPMLTEWGGYDPQRALVRLIREEGFEQVEVSWCGHDALFDSAEEFWEAQSSIVTEVRKRLLVASPEAAAGLKQAFLKKAEAVLQCGGKLIYPYGAFYVTASRSKIQVRIQGVSR